MFNGHAGFVGKQYKYVRINVVACADVLMILTTFFYEKSWHFQQHYG